jgi:methyl-accepting chemotaxis protein
VLCTKSGFTTIAAAVEEQGAASQEIARNVQQAAQGTQEVSSNIDGVTEAAQHTAAAASQLLGASGELSVQAETMRNQVEKFITSIKAA